APPTPPGNVGGTGDAPAPPWKLDPDAKAEREPGRTRRPLPPKPPPAMAVGAPTPPKPCEALTAAPDLAPWRAGPPMLVEPPVVALPPVMTQRSITTEGHELTEMATSPGPPVIVPPFTVQDSIQITPGSFRVTMAGERSSPWMVSPWSSTRCAAAMCCTSTRPFATTAAPA